jgi:hypothetical protein
MDHAEPSKLTDVTTKGPNNREFDLGNKIPPRNRRVILHLMEDLIKFFRLNSSFVQVVVQHPDRVRSAGFGQKDRRPVDPPPILKLTRLDDDNPIMLVSAIGASLLTPL